MTPLLIKNKDAECYFNGLLQAIIAEPNVRTFIAESTYTQNSLGETLRDFVDIYNTTDLVLEETASVEADELTTKLFKTYPKTRPSTAYGTGMQYNPIAALPLLNNITTDRIPETHNPFATYFTNIETFTNNTSTHTPEQQLSLKISLETRKRLTQNEQAQLPIQDYLKEQYITFKSKGKGSITRKLTRLADILIISTEDPEQRYTFPLEATINPKELGLTGANATYKLYAIIMRRSAGGLGGHYYTLVKYGTTWYVCDEPEADWYGGDKDIDTIKRSQLKLKNQNLIAEIAKKGSYEHHAIDYEGGKQVTVTLNDYPSMLFYTRGTLDRTIKKPTTSNDLIDLQRNLTLLAQTG